MQNQDRFSFYSLFVLLVVACSGLLFGYNTAVTSGLLTVLKGIYHLSAFEEGFVVSMLLLGGLAGALFAGTLADLWGRKKILISSAVIFCIGSTIFLFVYSYSLLLIGRFVTGLAIGIASVVSPLYLGEVAPPHYRGRFVSFFQFMLSIGILLAYIINIFFAKNELWRYAFFISIIPSLLQFIFLFFVPETPAWLFRHGNNASAVNALQELRDDKAWQGHLLEMKDAAAIEKKEKRFAFFNSTFRSIVLVGLTLSIFQQITGVNTVIYYAPKIFASSGSASASDSLLATLGIGIVNCIATFISLWLLDKTGRRILLLLGTLGMFFCQIILGFTLMMTKGPIVDVLSMVSMIFYVTFFSIGLGPVTWVILAEIFPLKIRGKAMTCALFVNWLANYVVSLTFLLLIHAFGTSGTFFIYGTISFAALIFIYYAIPETKGKSLEEIEQMVTKSSVDGRTR